MIRHVSRLRLHIIDADRIAHELLTDEQIIRQIVDVFGPTVLDADGMIDRRCLAERVFGSLDGSSVDSSTENHRRQLERILHPRIHQEVLGQIQQAPAGTDAVILDAALLLEAGWASECDALVFVDTPLPQRQQRVLENRNWSAEELARRESAQWEPLRKKMLSHHVVDNSGSVEDAAASMERVLRTIISDIGS